jgi:hypothetical protein
LKDCKCSIDRITGMAHIPDMSYFDRYVRRSDYVKAVSPYKGNGEYDKQVYCIDGSTISIKTKEKHEKNVRLDFNPNTLHGYQTFEHMQGLIAFMKYPHLTGIDFAVDYYGYDLSSLSVTPPRSMKKATYESAGGKLESIALGSGEGNRRINFYDKRHKERKSLPHNHPEWWRVEVQRARFNGEEDYFTNPFKDIAFTFPASFPPDIKAADKAMLLGLRQQPELWNELGRRQKERLREINMQSSTSLDPHPADVFEQYKEEMQKQLQQILAPALKNSPFYQAL